MTSDAVRSESAQKALDYMDKNGFEAVNFNGNNVNFDKTYVRQETDKPLDIDDPNSWFIQSKLQNSPQAYDEPTGVLFKQGTQDGKIYAFAPANPTTGETARGLKQREMDLQAIKANKDINKEDKLKLIQNVYSAGGNNYRQHRQAISLDDVLAKREIPKQDNPKSEAPKAPKAPDDRSNLTV